MIYQCDRIMDGYGYLESIALFEPEFGNLLVYIRSVANIG